VKARTLYYIGWDEKFPVYELGEASPLGCIALSEIERQDYLNVIRRYNSWQERLRKAAYALEESEN
jgi:hypothetical protein